MSQNPIHSLTAEARSNVDGEFISSSRVVDTLLDLRLLASADSHLVDLIDKTIGSIPGRSVAPNTWWIEALDIIDRQAESDGHGLHPLPA